MNILQKLLFVILFFLSVTCFSQSPGIFGDSFENILHELQNNHDLLDIKTGKTNNEEKYISFFTSNTRIEILEDIYYFSNSDNTLRLKVRIYPYASLNIVIALLNDKYVKLSETRWANYTKDATFYYSIIREDDDFLLAVTVK